jgi:hypothetical protein
MRDADHAEPNAVEDTVGPAVDPAGGAAEPRVVEPGSAAQDVVVGRDHLHGGWEWATGAPVGPRGGGWASPPWWGDREAVALQERDGGGDVVGW